MLNLCGEFYQFCLTWLYITQKINIFIISMKGVNEMISAMKHCAKFWKKLINDFWEQAVTAVIGGQINGQTQVKKDFNLTHFMLMVSFYTSWKY